MQQRHLAKRPAGEELLAQLLEPPDGKLLPGLVGQPGHATMLGVVPDGPEEDARPAGAGVAHETDGLVGPDGLAGHADEEALTHAAHRRGPRRRMAA